MEIGSLIGCNCLRALKPLEVILGNDEDPYATRTLLEWGIIGPAIPVNGATDEEDDHSTCHRVVTREIGSSARFDSKFVIEAQTKEVVNPFAVR